MLESISKLTEVSKIKGNALMTKRAYRRYLVNDEGLEEDSADEQVEKVFSDPLVLEQEEDGKIKRWCKTFTRAEFKDGIAHNRGLHTNSTPLTEADDYDRVILVALSDVTYCRYFFTIHISSF